MSDKNIKVEWLSGRFYAIFNDAQAELFTKPLEYKVLKGGTMLTRILIRFRMTSRIIDQNTIAATSSESP